MKRREKVGGGSEWKERGERNRGKKVGKEREREERGERKRGKRGGDRERGEERGREKCVVNGCFTPKLFPKLS